MKKTLIALSTLVLGITAQSDVTAGYVKTEALWPSNEIPVCFDSHWNRETLVNKKQWRKWVREGAEKWQTYSKVKFVGWENCNSSSMGLRIAGVKDESQSYHYDHLVGTELNGIVAGVEIPNELVVDPFRLPQIRAIITSAATYRFGTALGFVTERNRPDNASENCQARHSTTGDVVVGPKDKDSVLNCPRIALFAKARKLSDIDKRMVNFFYNDSKQMEFTPGGFSTSPDYIINATDAFAKGWDEIRHIRQTADINGDGIADLVGFGDRDVFTALGNGNGTFAVSQRGVRGFGHKRGWNKVHHIRTLADVNGDGKDDIVAFGDPGVYTALALGNGRFAKPRLAIKAFTSQTGGWNLRDHPRQLADINGDGRADIVGFGQNAVYTSLANSDGTFSRARKAVNSFTVGSGGWQQGVHFRQLGDVNGDGMADIIGVSSRGISTALSLGNGKFTTPKLALASRHFNGPYQFDLGDTLVDVDQDGLLDFLDIGQSAVTVFLAKPGGGFTVAHQHQAHFFAQDTGFISNNSQTIADVNGDGVGDLVAIAYDGVYASIARPSRASFGPTKKIITNFSVMHGKWNPLHPIFFTDLDGDGKDDVLGLGDNKVYTAFFNQ